MKDISYKPVRFEKIRLFFAAAAVVIGIAQAIGLSSMLRYNDHYVRELETRTISAEGLDSIMVGDRIDCILPAKNFLAFTLYNGVDYDRAYAAVMTPGEKILLIEINEELAPEVLSNAEFVYENETAEDFVFTGKVLAGNTELDKELTGLLTKDILVKNGLSMTDITPRYIQAYNPASSPYGTREIVITALSIVLMAAAAIFLAVPSLRNLRYRFAAGRGAVSPQFNTVQHNTDTDHSDFDSGNTRKFNSSDSAPIEYYQGGVNEYGNFDDDTRND